MKRKKRIILFVIQLFIVLILIAAIIYMDRKKDKVPPEIFIEQEAMILTEDEIQSILDGNQDVLMEGVTANDDRDGDITDEIFIYSVTPKNDNLYAIVNYRVLDHENNVGSANRIAYLKTPKEMHAIVMARYHNQGREDEKEENSKVDDAAYQAPVLKMRKEAVIAVGENFDPAPYIIEISDNKDSIQVLQKNAKVDGVIDVNTPGTYEVVFTLIDSDGNYSEPASIFVTVQ